MRRPARNLVQGERRFRRCLPPEILGGFDARARRRARPLVRDRGRSLGARAPARPDAAQRPSRRALGLRQRREGALGRAPGDRALLRPRSCAAPAPVPLSAVRAQRGSGRPGGGAAALREIAGGRVSRAPARLRAPPPRRHRALRPLPAPQRGARAAIDRGGGSVPGERRPRPTDQAGRARKVRPPRRKRSR